MAFSYSSNMNKIIIGAIVYYLLSTKGSLFATSIANEITVGRPKVKYKGLSWNGIKVLISIPITNNNKVSFPVSAVQGDVFYKGNLVGSFNSAKPFTLNPGELVTAEVNMNLGIEDAIKTITSAVEGLDLKLGIRGNIVSLGVNFPFTYTLQP